MGRSRGFFAELQHQNQLAAKRNEQAARAAHRASLAAQRDAERAQKAVARASAQRLRMDAAAQKAAEQEAKRLHEEAMSAQASAQNAKLADVYDEIDSILAATLGRDDYVDLNSLRMTAEHPPFAGEDLEVPLPPPNPPVAPPQPLFVAPEAPKGLGAMFAKKKHEELLAQRRAEHDAAHRLWQSKMAALPEIYEREKVDYEAREQARVAALGETRQQYEVECQQREAQAAESNRRLDEVISGIEYNVEEAIQQYVSIVLGNSVYPESFSTEHDFEFDASLKELSLTVLVPSPEDVPVEKEFRYVKAKDEVVASLLPKKDQKERYNNAVFQVALRTLHEVFEADRAGRIQTIALKVCATGNDPATGAEKRSVFVATSADRSHFMTFNLANVVPRATLEHLGALVSKSPFDMIEVDDSVGVRGR